MTVLPDTDISRAIDAALREHDLDAVHALIDSDPVAAHTVLVAHLGAAKNRLNRISAQIAANRTNGLTGRLASGDYYAQEARLQNNAQAAAKVKTDLALLVQHAQEQRRLQKHGSELQRQRAINDRLWEAITTHHAQSLALDLEPEPHDVTLWAVIGIKVRQP